MCCGDGVSCVCLRQIACLAEDVRAGLTTHRELDPTNMLSLVASLTPFSDYNQSPRNMYQVSELACIGLGWVGLGWVGLGWVGLGCLELFGHGSCCFVLRVTPAV